VNVADWLKRDAGQLISGLVQTLVFVSLGTWYVGGRLAEIDKRAALHDQQLVQLQQRIDQVKFESDRERSEVISELRAIRNDLRGDLIRLEDKIEGRRP
jgi:hypothetical protein